VVNDRTKKEMRKILKEIQTGKFARQWIAENESGSKTYKRLLKQDLNHPIERVGVKLRERMPWLKDTR
jgi:ketol-acid reductoisomerase